MSDNQEPRRDTVIRVRLSVREKKAWQRAAASEGRPLSELIREACNRHALGVESRHG